MRRDPRPNAALLPLLLLALTCDCGHRGVVLLADAPPVGADGSAAAFDAGHDTNVSPDAALEPCIHEVARGPLLIGESATARTPMVAYAGSHFAAVWVWTSGSAHPVVRMQIFDESGTPIGAELTAGPESHTWAELAAKESELAICWWSDPGLQGRVAFRRFDAQGTPLGESVDLAAHHAACSALVATPDGWAAVLRRWVTEENGYRYGIVRADPQGSPLGPTVEFAGPTPSSTRISLVHTGSGYFTTYSEARSADTKVVKVQRFTAQASIDGPPVQVTAGSADAHGAELVWTGTRLLLFYLLRPDSIRQLVMLQPLDPKGRPQGETVALTERGYASALSVTWTGSEVALGWSLAFKDEDASDPPPQRIFLARLRPDGTRIQPDLELQRPEAGSNEFTSVAGSGQRLGIVWQAYDGDARVGFALTGCKAGR